MEACERYKEQMRENPNFKNEQNEVQNAKHELERYSFYYQRF